MLLVAGQTGVRRCLTSRTLLLSRGPLQAAFNRPRTFTAELKQAAITRLDTSRISQLTGVDIYHNDVTPHMQGRHVQPSQRQRRSMRLTSRNDHQTSFQSGMPSIDECIARNYVRT